MRSFRIRFLLGVLASWVALASGGSAAPARPNILFLFSDDQRADTIGAWGNTNILTPNLDRLASAGFSFRNNYCFGGNSGAVCIPSRAMLMSGRTWFHVDHSLTGVPTLPELLRRAGYHTFGTGKWHNGPASFVRSFGTGRSVFFGGMADHTRVTIQDLQPDGSFSPKRTATQFSSQEFADAVIEFLNRPPEASPFFAYVAFTAPHDPRNPPSEWRERYYRRRPPLPANYLPQHPFDNGQLVIRDEELLPWPRPPELLRDQLAEYYGLISHLDLQIGRILEALERSRHATNTYVVFASDHGLALGGHGLLGKQSLYEDSMRCPLIVVGPGVPAGQSSAALTYLHDLFPTVCARAGVEPPAGIEGEDLEPVWSGQRPRVRDSLFLAYLGLMRAVRDERWKLVCYPPINHRQLFDLRNDPDERVDVGGDPGRSAEVERLLGLMRDWQRRVGDTLSLTVADPKPLMRDLTGLGRKPDEWQPAWIVEKYFGNR